MRNVTRRAKDCKLYHFAVMLLADSMERPGSLHSVGPEYSLQRAQEPTIW
jgi:hypothetical protein